MDILYLTCYKYAILGMEFVSAFQVLVAVKWNKSLFLPQI